MLCVVGIVSMSKLDYARPPLYLLVIGMAMTLPEPWMIALQAAFGGFVLGLFVARKICR
jgi:hypothetical protein